MAGRKRNKKRKVVNSFAVPVPFAGVVVMICVLGLSYIWLVGRCEAVGRDLKKLEKEYRALEKQYLNEEFRWVRMKSPENIEKALKRHGIKMDWPRRDQIVRLRRTDVYKDRVANSGDILERALDASGMIMNE